MWFFETRRGTFAIRLRSDGRYVLMFDDDVLESHDSPDSAALAAGTGNCTWPWIGDPVTFGVPSEIMRWRRG
jgi:hypothetical protein